jgi:hypothetical protein
MSTWTQKRFSSSHQSDAPQTLAVVSAGAALVDVPQFRDRASNGLSNSDSQRGRIHKPFAIVHSSSRRSLLHSRCVLALYQGAFENCLKATLQGVKARAVPEFHLQIISQHNIIYYKYLRRSRNNEGDGMRSKQADFSAKMADTVSCI